MGEALLGAGAPRKRAPVRAPGRLLPLELRGQSPGQSVPPGLPVAVELGVVRLDSDDGPLSEPRVPFGIHERQTIAAVDGQPERGRPGETSGRPTLGGRGVRVVERVEELGPLGESDRVPRDQKAVQVDTSARQGLTQEAVVLPFADLEGAGGHVHTAFGPTAIFSFTVWL